MKITIKSSKFFFIWKDFGEIAGRWWKIVNNCERWKTWKREESRQNCLYLYFLFYLPYTLYIFVLHRHYFSCVYNLSTCTSFKILLLLASSKISYSLFSRISQIYCNWFEQSVSSNPLPSFLNAAHFARCGLSAVHGSSFVSSPTINIISQIR